MLDTQFGHMRVSQTRVKQASRPIFWFCLQVVSNRLHYCQALLLIVSISLNSVAHFLSCSSGCLQWPPPCPFHLGPSCLSSYWVSEPTCGLDILLLCCMTMAELNYLFWYRTCHQCYWSFDLKKKRFTNICLLSVVFWLFSIVAVNLNFYD